VNYLRGFIPWIAFAVIPGWQWGALTALLIGFFLLVKQHKAGVGMDALILETSTVLYFAALAVLAFSAPFSPLHHFSGALSFAWLALTAWGTLAVRKPFTLGIARLSTPREYWNTPQFLRINVVITTVWAAAFTLTAIAVVISEAANASTVVAIVCQVVGFVVPAVFTARYPKIVQARYAAQAQAQATQ
jgi:hypothetical protein